MAHAGAVPGNSWEHTQMKTNTRRRIAGQGMTEYIIIVALVAVAAIGVYTAFGDVVRGQASVAAVALSGGDNPTGRAVVTAGRASANVETRRRDMDDFED